MPATYTVSGSINLVGMTMAELAAFVSAVEAALPSGSLESLNLAVMPTSTALPAPTPSEMKQFTLAAA